MFTDHTGPLLPDHMKRSAHCCPVAVALHVCRDKSQAGLAVIYICNSDRMVLPPSASGGVQEHVLARLWLRALQANAFLQYAWHTSF